MKFGQPFTLALVMCLFLAGAPVRGDEAAEAEAVAVSQAWLAVVDQGDYGVGWERAAKLLKTAVTRAQFVQALTAARTPLGAVVSRKLKDPVPDGVREQALGGRDDYADGRPGRRLANFGLLHPLARRKTRETADGSAR
jgi:hypothetical protein